MNNTLETFKNCLSGRKVIIMGNGPSLRKVDFNKLESSDVVTFCTNRINLIFKKTHWRPCFYSCFASAPLNCKEWRESVLEVTKNNSTICFLPSFFSFVNFSQDNIVKIEKVGEHYRHDPVPHNLFDTGPTICVLKSFSATVTMFQLCFYMGVKKIGIVGQDGYLIDRESNHFTKEYVDTGSRKFKKINERIENVHNVLNKFAAKNEIDIKNLSNMSILNNYELCDLDYFLKDA